jgi:cytoskeletal protein CcmA (bactofilin family)
MGKNKTLALLILIPLLLIGCTVIPPQNNSDDGTLIIGEVYTLESGKTVYGNLVVIGSSFTMEEGAQVLGDVSLIGSTTQIGGQVNGDVFAFAGSSTLESSGVIHGDLNQVFHKLNQRDGSTITGEISTFSSPQTFQPFWNGFNLIMPFFANPEKVVKSRLILSAVFVFLACLIAYLLPKPTRNVMRTIQNQVGVSWGVGFVITLVSPVVIVVLAITICLSPFALVLLVIWMVAALFGWIAMAALLGELLNRWFYLKMNLVLQSLTGGFLIALLVSLITLIPIVGFLLAILLGCYGLGGVVISRFGKFEDTGERKKRKKNMTPQ